MKLQFALLPKGIAALLATAAAAQLLVGGTGNEELNTPRPLTKIGDSKAEIRVVSLSQPGTWRSLSFGAVRLGDVLSDDCEYVMVFHPDCYWCHYYAKSWTGVEAVTAGGTLYGVKWLSIDPSIEKSRAFLETHSIPAEGIVVSSMQEARRVAVNGTPSLWILRAGKVLSTNAGIEPILEKAPLECSLKGNTTR